MKTKRIISLLLSAVCLCAAVLPGAIVASAEDNMPEFTDVTETHPHYKAIMFCAENKFVYGKGDNKFGPDEALTREQMALIWARTFHVERSPHTFNDVAKVSGGEADMAIIVLHGLGILKGVSPTEFGRNTAITREQAITMTARTYLPFEYEGKDADKYDDAKSISDWAYEAVSRCVEAGILKGVFSGSKLLPQNPITRGELCQIITNVMYKEPEDPVTPTPDVSASPEPSATPSPDPSATPDPDESATPSPDQSATPGTPSPGTPTPDTPTPGTPTPTA